MSTPLPASPSLFGDYPDNYRSAEIHRIHGATQAGDCVAIIGLSGAGKSNLLGYLSERGQTASHRFALVDCNRLPSVSAEALLDLIGAALAPVAPSPGDGFARADGAILARLASQPRLTLLIDRLDVFALSAQPANAEASSALNALRALRDMHKYALTYVLATRHALPEASELSELCYANTVYLGVLARSDALWNVTRFAARHGTRWPASDIDALIALSGGYPSLLRAACEAYQATGNMNGLESHPALTRRVAEFWADTPSPAEVAAAGLGDLPIIVRGRPPEINSAGLTAKEHALLTYFLANPNDVCDKDALIRAVWSEDKAFIKGIRDDSLAQLVRRLREKIEPDPAKPRHILAVPGRGYRYVV